MLISVNTLSLYLPAVLALNLTPGNDMLLCINQGLRNGPLAGMAASAGIAAGSIVHTAIAALGLKSRCLFWRLSHSLLSRMQDLLLYSS